MTFDGFLQGVNQVYDIVASKEGAAVSVLVFLYGISKRIPNSDAGKVIAGIQVIFDGVAAAFLAIGRLCNLIGSILHKIIASDGYGGVK